MSLRKSPERTPAFLAAHRRNARKSTGPQTPTGKARSSLNALKHGRYAGNLPFKMRAAGIREVVRVFKYRKQISRLFEGKSGRMLTERSSNTLAIAIWREHQVRRRRRFDRLLNKEGALGQDQRPPAKPRAWNEEQNTRGSDFRSDPNRAIGYPRSETRVPQWREDINRMLDAQMPIITEEQLEHIRLKIAQSSEQKGSKEK